MLVGLLFEREATRANHVAFGKDADAVGSFAEKLVDVPVGGDGRFLQGSFD